MRTELDGLIKDLSAERISAGFWSSVLEYIDSTLNFEGLLSPLSAASDAGWGGDPTASKEQYALTQRDSVCPIFRNIHHQLGTILVSLQARGFNEEEIGQISGWSKISLNINLGAINGKRVSVEDIQIVDEEFAKPFTLYEARDFLDYYKFMCSPSLQDSIPNLVDSARGFFSATPGKLQELQGLASNLSKDVLRDAIATRVEEEDREEQLHVY